MEVVQQCLNLAPVPCLGPAFALFKSIWDVVQRISSYKYQLKELAKTIALLISKLNERYRTQGPADSSTWDSLSDFGGILSDILDMVTNQKNYSFFKLLFVKDDMQATINSYHQRITATFRAFQISALLDIQALEQQNMKARQLDHEQVVSKLQEMERNQNIMIRELQGQTKDPMLTMAALQKRLKNRQGDDAELRFFSRSFDYIKQTSGARFEYEDWMVTSLEVEFGRVISRGGFGIVHQGKWNGCEVALKVLKNSEGVTPHEKDLRNEIKTWSKLRHVNILQFLGASVLDDEPFIVMPLVKHGSVRDYLIKYPHANRVKIIHDISLGIVYLHNKHNKPVIHGDIKGANVLIDEGERPLLCDFGLSRIKENVDSRSSNQATSSAQGSINWMAPERLEGGRLRTPCDIYSFGMTMYEIHTNSTPLGGVLPSNFLQLVAVSHKRPLKPQQDEAPQLTSDGWTLMTKCWAPEPMDRPKIETVCAELAHMKISTVIPNARMDAFSPQDYSGATSPLPPPGYSSDRPPRRQTSEDPRPTSQRPPPSRTQTHHPYPGNMGHTHSQNLGHLPIMPIREEPFEMDVPFINPSNHPNNRRNTGNYGKHPSQGPGGSQQYVSPASVYIPQPSAHTQYPSPPHSAPSYSPPAPYDLPTQIRNAYSEGQTPNNSPPFLPQGTAPTYPPGPGKNYTIDSTQPHPQAPQLNSRSHTLPVPANPYVYSDRSRSPDPAFPQPQYPH
ncbi:kinase-like protein [Pholiota conissans]|uniref:Kinase-like protein n=1 Tax=Pholiota conissans TaxID=109636 RepID=A0A9P6CY02_9AGAR|nr:kinase-like protein [Pholiota conissans]